MRYSASGRRGSGSFGSDRTAGHAIGEGRTSPWLEAITGIRHDYVPGWVPSLCRLPGPVRRYVQKSPSGFHRHDCNKHPPGAPDVCVRWAECVGQKFPGGSAMFYSCPSGVAVFSLIDRSLFFFDMCAGQRVGQDVRRNSQVNLVIR